MSVPSAAAGPVGAGSAMPLVDRVRRRLADTGAGTSAQVVAAAVRAESGGVAGDAQVLGALRQLHREFIGAGPLQPLLDDPATTDVLVTGPDQVWVDRGVGVRPAGVRFGSEDAVRRLAQRLAAAAGRRLDDAAPFVDARLPDGTRLHAVLAPIATGGTCISLRAHRPAAHGLAELRALGTFTAELEGLLRAVLRTRLAFLVTGGTGSGKTTLLGALLGAVAPTERIVSVEDSGELAPAHPHVVRLVARPANVEGTGAVGLRELLRQALRMRPDRLVVGEVRGAEVCELLAALNTGHEGGAGTVHANSPAEVPARLEALAALGGLDRPALHSQLAAAVQVVVHMHRGHDGRRVLAEIGVVRRAADADRVEVSPVWRLGSGWRAGRPVLLGLLRARGAGAPC
jgi:pilus assembly protein CpaF